MEKLNPVFIAGFFVVITLILGMGISALAYRRRDEKPVTGLALEEVVEEKEKKKEEAILAEEPINAEIGEEQIVPAIWSVNMTAKEATTIDDLSIKNRQIVQFRSPAGNWLSGKVVAIDGDEVILRRRGHRNTRPFRRTISQVKSRETT